MTFRVSIAEYVIAGTVGGLPPAFQVRAREAALFDELGFAGDAGTVLIVEVARLNDRPFLVVAQRFEPGPEAAFFPGVLLVPEHHTLFIGAGERLLAYDLGGPRRLWEDSADTGFWGWARHGDVAVMSAELELAAWDIRGNKLWSTFVEPPWDYRVEGDAVHLDVMGEHSTFSLRQGPDPVARTR